MSEFRNRLRSHGAQLAERAGKTGPGQRLADALGAEQIAEQPQPAAAPSPFHPDDVDSWLTNLFGEQLTEIEAACANPTPEAYALFRDLDDDVWALLLSRQYTSYPNILALLPEVPAAELQRSWNGSSGLELLTQSKAFYRKAKERFAAEGEIDLADARILDFGCGWGRLTRFFARDVAPGALHGCDPVEEILQICRDSRLPAELSKSEFVPEKLPVEGFDLAFSFSVFTHISEQAAETCLRAIHAALNPGGILVMTIRPPAYLDLDPKMHPLRDTLRPDPVTALQEPRYLFVSHGADPTHPQYESGEMTYGDSVISLAYVRERWGELFELRDVQVSTEDIYQVTVTLKRKG